MIFIWIPKTGGTTFASLHPDMKVITDRYNHMTHDYKTFEDITWGHACPKLLIKRGIIDADVWNKHEKVAIVRNPFTRFLSLFHDYKRTGRISQGMTQTGFIRAIIEMDPKPGYFNSYQLSMCAPQVEWLLPGIKIMKFEENITTMDHHLNNGGYEDGLDRRAVDEIKSFYGADFVTLGYSDSYDHIQ